MPRLRTLTTALTALLLGSACLTTVSSERVPIKINTHDRPHSNNDATSSSRYSRTTSQRGPSAPILYRQPHPPVLPPFLATEAISTVGAATDSTITPHYYDSLADSNAEAAHSTQTRASPAPAPHTGSSSASQPPYALPDEPEPVPEPTDLEAAARNAVNDAWLALDGQCWTHTTREYVYSVCPFQNVTQKSTKTVLHVVLGVFDGWIEEGPPPVMLDAPATTFTPPPASDVTDSSLVMLYTDGTNCSGGKRRMTRVEFVCEPRSSDSYISDVTEPATCEYAVSFHTPLMCNENDILEAQRADARAKGVAYNMQLCIDALYQHIESSASLPLSESVEAQCAEYLPPLQADAASAATVPADTLSPQPISSVSSLAAGVSNARPNHFISLRIAEPTILTALNDIQKALVAFDPAYAAFLVPQGTYHITLSLLCLSSEAALATARTVMERLAPRIRDMFRPSDNDDGDNNNSPTRIVLRGLSTFGDRVLFADLPRDGNRSRLTRVAALLADEFAAAGVGCAQNKADSFTPHLTIAKMEGGAAADSSPSIISPASYAAWAQHDFGSQAVLTLDLCAMGGTKQADGYYQVKAAIQV